MRRRQQRDDGGDLETGTEVVQFKPSRLPYDDRIGSNFDVDRASWKALVEAVFPLAKSADSIALVLSYCKARGLDPFKRVVHIVPMWDSQLKSYRDTVWPGIAEFRITAHRTGAYAGCDETEFGPEMTRTFKGKVKDETITRTVTFPEWARITVYRIVGGMRCPFVGPKVLWLETYAAIGNTEVPNDMWAQSRTEGQLEKCAEAGALRRAFPEELGNEYTAEEMQGKRLHPNMKTIELPEAAAKPKKPPRSFDALLNGKEPEPAPHADMAAEAEVEVIEAKPAWKPAAKRQAQPEEINESGPAQSPRKGRAAPAGQEGSPSPAPAGAAPSRFARAEDDGFEAFAQGLRLRDVPEEYAEDRALTAAWKRGWQRASDSRQHGDDDDER